MKFYYTLYVLTLLCIQLYGQSILSQADKEFNVLAYQKAATLYESIIKEKQLTVGEKLSAQAKLGYSYRQLKDSDNAERAFRELIIEYGKDLPQEYLNCYLFYAQALAGNGKYQEAQETYEKYNSLKADDSISPKFSKLSQNVSLLTKNIGSYKVDYLTINSSASEFSPVFYKEGMMFVSNRNEGLKIKRVFNWDETAFLDLYFLKDLNKIKGKPSSPSSMGGSFVNNSRSKKRKSLLGMDEYSPLTPNDSRKVGFFSGSGYNTSLGYDERPLTESEKISKSLNTKYHEGPATFSKDGNRVIFTRNNFNNGEYKVSQDGINKLKLYSAELINGKWTNVEELPFNSDEYSNGHPAYNPDNSVLYFASDRPGGFGGTDLYVTRFKGDTWTEPVNMGPVVNTSGSEMFPFVDSNGNLYFSSDGHPGMGELDVFFSPMEAYNSAKKVINLGAPINSNKDDFGLITDAERSEGYFSSNRKNGGKDDDIYRFRREGPLYACRDLTVMVYDEETNVPLKNVLVQLENKSVSEDLRQLRTDSTGNLLLCLAAENDFLFVASGEGYLNSTVGFSTSAYGDDHPSLLEIPLKKSVAAPSVKTEATLSFARGEIVSQKENLPMAGVKIIVRDETDGDIQEVFSEADGSYRFEAVEGHNYSIDAVLDKYGTFGRQVVGYKPEATTDLSIMMFEKGDIVKINNIFYDFDKFEIRKDAGYELDKVAVIMNKYPGMKIELGSHTDSRASAWYNKALSNNRAKAAKGYLVSKGIDARRLTAKGYGESKLANNCGDRSTCTEEEHQKNRRTEIKILNLQ
jgi:outer membrane protein OmpA-like peptidoglycan-associated protein/tetratricopeptide (TPR) repeat protein